MPTPVSPLFPRLASSSSPAFCLLDVWGFGQVPISAGGAGGLGFWA